ncbi:MAG: TatD DNase family protein [Comamonadaceae bacterium]|nr:MAG: TatD DNase family protein [Comamonadaceae bacterium]
MTTRPQWVDFHCHVDLYPDHEALIKECDQECVATLAVTTTPKAWMRNSELATNSSCVRVALGLHPQLVRERAGELSLFESLLPTARYVGEIGLDAGPKFYSSFAEQERVFARILQMCAEQGRKILTIHSVRTVGKVLKHLEANLPPDRGTAVLHWFTGTVTEARRAAEMGCYFSINAEMLISPKAIGIVRTMPLDRLLTETDGPFVSEGSARARPKDVRTTVDMMADALGIGAHQLQAQILHNLKVLTSR